MTLTERCSPFPHCRGRVPFAFLGGISGCDVGILLGLTSEAGSSPRNTAHSVFRVGGAENAASEAARCPERRRCGEPAARPTSGVASCLCSGPRLRGSSGPALLGFACSVCPRDPRVSGGAWPPWWRVDGHSPGLWSISHEELALLGVRAPGPLAGASVHFLAPSSRAVQCRVHVSCLDPSGST